MPGSDTPGLLLLGGATGIGGRIAAGWRARYGSAAPLWVTYRSDRDGATTLAAELGGTALPCDASDATSVAAVRDAVTGAGGLVGTLVHAAVDPAAGLLTEGPAGRLLSALDVSAVSLVTAVTVLGPALADGGSVVFLSSIGASRVVPAYGNVGVAKAAAEAIVRYLAVELGPRGIRVNAVSSGPVATKALSAILRNPQRLVEVVAARSPLQPAADVDDVAGFVAMLCGPEARGVTGQVIAVDGGAFLTVT